MWWEVGATAQNPPIIPHSQMHLATPGLPCAPITSLSERLAEDGGQAEGGIVWSLPSPLKTPDGLLLFLVGTQ